MIHAGLIKATVFKTVILMPWSWVINIIKTQGDAIQHLSFDKLEGKGFFTKEIEKKL